MAQDLAEAKILAYALYDTGAVHHFRRERGALQELGETLVALAREQEFSFDLASGFVLCGLAMIEHGRKEEGIEQLHHGLSALQGTGAILPRTVWSAPLAEAYGHIGCIDDGMTLISETLELAEKTGARTYESELYRVRGELTLQQTDKALRAESGEQKSENLDPRSQILDSQGEAEACFRKAIEIAQRQQAKSLELRAATSLARLWQSQGKATEARDLLAPVYNWFTEGFDTADLKDAKALLAELTQL